MLKHILLLCLLYQVNCQILPVIYAAPSSVSHQSRIDVKHTPQIIATPLVYSPTVYAIYPNKEKESNIVLTPVTSDMLLTPIAFTFFHNLPLSRALEHPIIIENQDSNGAESQLSNVHENFINTSKKPEEEISNVAMGLPT